MKYFLIILCSFCGLQLFSQSFTEVEKNRILLPNGWSLTPAGKSIELGDLPLNMVVSHDRKMIAVTNNGQSKQTIQLIDAVKEQEMDRVVIGKSWYGLAFSADDHFLYASGGNDNIILKYAIRNDKLTVADTLVLGKKWPVKISPAGIAVNDSRQLLYVVTKENNSLYIVDLQKKSVIQTIPLGSEAYSCMLSKDQKTLFISLWGAGKILLFDTKSNTKRDSIVVGDHPNECCFSKNEKYLFVANANDNSVSVIDVAKSKVIETLNAALFPNSPSGSTSNGVALSEEGKTLYVANADNNSLAVFDVSVAGKSISKGFIPVGWYPTNVKVIGKKIFVSNGKGFTSKANPYGPNPFGKKQAVNYQQGDNSKPQEVQYIAGLFSGTLSIIPEPSPEELSVYSKAVYQNSPYNKDNELIAKGAVGNPIPMKVGDPSPIKYVFYIIKENRTYDQVLGDMPGGNGDTSLVLFGKKYTPNLHALAGNFVLLDNFYCDAEVSADGHNWSMGAYATDYLEKTWPTSYGGRGGDYDGEGVRAIANNKAGFIWNNCQRNKVSYRTYGEFTDSKKASLPVLENHFCTTYAGWDLAIRDTTRFRAWTKDFDSLVAIQAVPNLNTLRFGNDHTEGIRKGRPSPYAHVADNDLAVGMFIDYLSKSPIWKESAVFIVEDDAQNGADHVDAHRTTAYVISPYVKRNYTDHSLYSTSSLLRTIELILGLPPMTQYDAAAPSMWQSFTANPDLRPYQYLPENISLDEKNTASNEAAKKSAAFDFKHEDNIPDYKFNEVLWLGLKGKQAPAPSRAAFVKVNTSTEKDLD